MTLQEFLEKKYQEKEITEAKVKDPQQNIVDKLKKWLGAKKSPMPEEVDLVRTIAKNNDEWELYYFINTCVFYEVPHRDNPPQGWYNTAAVAPAGDKVVFLYDKPFLKNTTETKYYREGKEISKEEYRKASEEEKAQKKVKAVVDVGKTLFLVAHEAMHVFRRHHERQQAAKFDDPNLYNIASDMVINRQLMKHYGKIGAQEFKFIDGGVILDKDELSGFKEHYDIKDDDQLKHRLNAEDVYRWLKANANKQKGDKSDQGESEDQQEISKRDLLDKSEIVKVKSGKYKGQYRKIIDRKADGTILTEPISEEEVKKELFGSVKKKRKK